MATCITQDLKSMLITFLNQKKPHELLAMFVEGMMPICEQSMFPPAAEVKSSEARGNVTKFRWGQTTYYDEKGKSKDYDSPSALFEELFHHSPSMVQECQVVKGEVKCTPKTMVMSFQGKGFTVRGDGEPPPIITHEMKEADRIRLHQEWGEHLKATGKHMRVYHPKSPALKKLDQE